MSLYLVALSGRTPKNRNMATAVLVFAGKSVATPAISFFVNKAFSYLNKYRKAEGLEAVKNRLEENIPKIQSVIDVVDPDYIKDKSEALDAWLWQLRDAVEEAEDAIDELEVESDQNKKALEGLDEAAKGVENFLTLVKIHQKTRSNLNNPEQDNISFRAKGKDLNADRVFGREDEKEHIVGWLTNNTSSEDNQVVMNNNHVPIMSIVVHGGIGKTTLAQLISHDSRIKKHFDTVIWVAVSMSFDPKTLFDKIIQSVTLSKPSVDTYEALQEHLKKEIETIKYLLILDDIWEDKDISKWENLFSSLRTGVCGRKILLTTRMQSVADLASAAMRCERKLFPLCGLEEDENLRLFNHHAFINPDPQEFEDFQHVGKEIAKKLRRCPLVTKVVAGHLRAHMKVQFWNTFLHEHLDNFDGSMENVVKVLKLSYYHLVPAYKCASDIVAYFPKTMNSKKKNW
uniref:NB-ARC domain-containing protein n=1 Tax=Oryza punctata TaxID=4537 RepID=A0A0E0MKL7_ORYPU